MIDKLKPCPFCGGEARVNERYRGGTANRKMYWISCSACGISQQHDNTSGYRYQSKAIDRWNTRKPIDKVIEQLEKASCYIEDGCGHAGHLVFTDDAIEIVKKGGVEE